MAVAQTSTAVYCAAIARMADASALATRLSLPLVNTADDRYALLLTFTPKRLELRKTGRGAPGPVYADFVSGPFGYRRKHGSGRRQLLARAIGIRASLSPCVIDVTAGLGADAFVLAMLGCRVLMVERSAIAHALLSDGLARARKHSTLETITSERLALRHDDAIFCLNALADKDAPDAIYLDPMYPLRHQSALAKKEMRLLRELVGDDEDAPDLLTVALARAKRRVVVKRPRLAPVIQGPPPDVQLRGETTRYDIYIARRLRPANPENSRTAAAIQD